LFQRLVVAFVVLNVASPSCIVDSIHEPGGENGLLKSPHERAATGPIISKKKIVYTPEIIVRLSTNGIDRGGRSGTSSTAFIESERRLQRGKFCKVMHQYDILQ
jgi:hypothetical protein